MIPSIFISSTIADLRYLRDGLRDAIIELAYQPVMSEYGEVGYLHPTTAAGSCYRTVTQCQMVVLIVGKRYGSIVADGLSVTHKEFQAAQEHQIPVITFVEPQVLSYKEVFDVKPNPEIWDDFTATMDNPRKTFQLLDEICDSSVFNGIIPFNSVGEAKAKLKLQIADFVGARLAETASPVNTQLRDVLAEISTVRKMLLDSSESMSTKEEVTKRYHAATRFLLNDTATEYRKLLEILFGDLDAAIAEIVDCESFEAVLNRAGYTHTVVSDKEATGAFMGLGNIAETPPEALPIHASFGASGGYAVYRDKRAIFGHAAFRRFSGLQKALHAKVSAHGSIP
jgi:hypothetical protein